jgi:predicted metal-dependent enzyme (double-stranded beta helix superfamily)
MCGDARPPASGREEYVLDTPRLRRFIEHVNEVRRAMADPREGIARIRPAFAELLAAPDWLPAQYQAPAPASGMGRGIGMWLLYRAGDGGLAFSALVVPAGMHTPVHDHLAWGLVGLYRGEQEEDVFTRRDDASAEGRADLALSLSQRLRPGDFYELLPENDIHRVRTISPTASVSLHLLGNDNGCIWRHRFLPEEGRVEPFRSGYVNAPCDPDA